MDIIKKLKLHQYWASIFLIIGKAGTMPIFSLLYGRLLGSLSDSTLFMQYIFYIGMVNVGSFFLDFFYIYLMQQFGPKVAARLKKQIVKELMKKDSAFFANSSSGALNNSFLAETSAVKGFCSTVLPEFLRNTFILLWYMGIAAYINYIFFIVMFVTSGLTITISLLTSTFEKLTTKKVAEEKNLAKTQAEITLNWQVIRVFARQNHFIEKIKSHLRRVLSVEHRLAFILARSTSLSLLLKLYQQYEGKILVNGINLHEISSSNYYESIGYVAQDVRLFYGTIEENIRFGVDDCSMFEVEEAAQRANIHEFILHLPEGYKTIIGEQGVNLSGGQKQRMAIARALIRNPKILIFDEATSALDSTSETMIQKAIEALSSSITVIVVAHRLSTIINATKIYVFSEGRIVEEGNYQNLISRNGYFASMVAAQQLEKQEDFTRGRSYTS